MWPFTKKQEDEVTQQLTQKVAGIVRGVLEAVLGDTEEGRVNIIKLQDVIAKLNGKIQDRESNLAKLREDGDKLKLDHKLEKIEIEHAVKVVKEKHSLEIEKEKVRLQGEANKREMELQRKNHEEAMRIIEDGKKEIRDIYTEILKRLPNVNASLNLGNQPPQPVGSD